MLTEIDATYKVTTPMFCGGADPRRAEFRLSSFKGVLRYWWRALAWVEYSGNLALIREHEGALFGSTGGGQSLVTMRLTGTVEDDLETEENGARLRVGGKTGHGHNPYTGGFVGQGARYLGYGVMDHRGRLSRGCLRAPFEFGIRMRVREPAGTGKDVKLELLQDALIAVGVVGGMGAKSRKGYGSLVLRSLKLNGKKWWDAPGSESELKVCVRRLRRGGGNGRLPEYTAFSSDARHVLVSSSSGRPLELLDLIGRELVRYRSWGRKGTILEAEDSEKRFRDDHDLMKGVGPNRIGHPRRIAFGLPHNYGRGRKNQVVPADGDLDRRASPLFIHIHECGDKPVAVLSFLPARFLPEGRSLIRVRERTVPQRPEKTLYGPIHKFLDRLLDPKKRREEIRATEVDP